MNCVGLLDSTAIFESPTREKKARMHLQFPSHIHISSSLSVRKSQTLDRVLCHFAYPPPTHVAVLISHKLPPSALVSPSYLESFQKELWAFLESSHCTFWNAWIYIKTNKNFLCHLVSDQWQIKPWDASSFFVKNLTKKVLYISHKCAEHARWKFSATKTPKSSIAQKATICFWCFCERQKKWSRHRSHRATVCM